MKKTKYTCPTCHRQIQFKQKMCPACETRIDWSGSFCPNCNYRLEEGTDCPFCGWADYKESSETALSATENLPEKTYYDEMYNEPSLWGWYFCKHPRVLILVPIFLYFTLRGIALGVFTITDIIYFFQQHTWGAVAVYLVFGTIMIPLLFLPAILSFYSIKWLYSTFIELKNAWAKLGLTIFLILILPEIESLIRYLYLLILGISEKYQYGFLPFGW